MRWPRILLSASLVRPQEPKLAFNLLKLMRLNKKKI